METGTQGIKHSLVCLYTCVLVTPRNKHVSIRSHRELLVILGILLFGVRRIGKIAGGLGSGIRAFKSELQGDDSKND